MTCQSETKFKVLVYTKLRKLKVACNKKLWMIKTQERGRRGTPDFLLCLCGKFVALELKTSKGKLDLLQEYNIEKINDADGYAVKLSPDNLDAVFEQLYTIAGVKYDVQGSLY